MTRFDMTNAQRDFLTTAAAALNLDAADVAALAWTHVRGAVLDFDALADDVLLMAFAGRLVPGGREAQAAVAKANDARVAESTRAVREALAAIEAGR